MVAYRREAPSIILVGIDRRILYVNQAFLNLAADTGIYIQKEDRVDQDVLNFVRPDEVGMWSQIYDDVIQRGGSYHDTDYTEQRRDGSLITLEVDARPLRSPDGRMVGARDPSGCHCRTATTHAHAGGVTDRPPCS